MEAQRNVHWQTDDFLVIRVSHKPVFVIYPGDWSLQKTS